MSMKFLLSTAVALLTFNTVHAQITITADDMPVHGDTLRYSTASPTGAASWAADSGANRTWNYELIATGQGMEDYKYPGEVNPLLLGFPPLLPGISARYSYGTVIADSIPGLGLISSGITIKDLRTYFSKFTSPSCFVAEAFSATITGFALGTDYILPDMWYHFPLSYGSMSSNDFHLKFGAATAGSIEQKGTRTTRVDGWGTITTPFYTTPTPCIRVRSEIVEIDSVTFSGTTFGLPRTTVEYRWLVNGDHMPALFASAISVGGAELPTTVRYRDHYRPEFATGVANLKNQNTSIAAYPTPAANGLVTLQMPDSWKNYVVEVYDMGGKLLQTYTNRKDLNLSALPAGNYMARITAGQEWGVVKIVR